MFRPRRPLVGARGACLDELVSTEFLFVTDRPPLDVVPTGFTPRYSAFIDEMSAAGTTSLVVAPKPSLLESAGIGTSDVHQLLSDRFGSEVAAICVLEPPEPHALAANIRNHGESWYRRRDPWTALRALQSVTHHPGSVVLTQASLAHLGYKRGGKRTVFLLEEGFDRARVPGRRSINMNVRSAYARATSRSIYRAVGKTGGLVVAISENEARYFARWIPEEQIVTIPNGIDLDQFSEPHAARARTASDRFTIGVVGNLGAARNVEPTLELVRSWQTGTAGEQLRNVQWRLVGASPTADILALDGPSVVVAGYVPDLAGEYARFDVVVIPANDAQGAKSTLLAAWASGVATVVSAASAAVMPVTNGQNALIFGSPREGLEALARLQSDPDLRSRIADQGRQTAQGYDARSLAKQLMPLIATGSS